MAPGLSPLTPETVAFYQAAMRALREAGQRFLVGGAYAFAPYTGIERHTKDLDLFVHPAESGRILEVLAAAGYRCELKFPHWLGKAWRGDDFVDLIFSSGSGIAVVDDAWFHHAVPARVFDTDVGLIPAEEMIWSKAFVMERERYDGADVIHIMHTRGPHLDWTRVMDRFADYWRILLLNLVLYGFVYPGEASPAPRWVMDALLARLDVEREAPPTGERICQGTLISREQYLADLLQWGYTDARMQPRGPMSAKEIAHWTQAIGKG